MIIVDQLTLASHRSSFMERFPLFYRIKDSVRKQKFFPSYIHFLPYIEDTESRTIYFPQHILRECKKALDGLVDLVGGVCLDHRGPFWVSPEQEV